MQREYGGLMESDRENDNESGVLKALYGINGDNGDS